MQVLVAEDCEITQMLIEELVEDIPGVDLVFASHRQEVLQLLQERTDFQIVFLDWNLLGGTTEGVGSLVKETQSNLIRVIGISGEKETRKMQVEKEGLDAHCEKTEVPDKIGEIVFSKTIH